MIPTSIPEPGRETAALVVFALVYAVLGFGALPPLRVDRAGAALIGATAMVALGVLAPQQAVAAIDFHTIALLLGMMIVVAHLRLAGFFGWLDECLLRRIGGPHRRLVATLWLSGGVSALFVNDTACILLTPLVLEGALETGQNPVPFLLAVAMGANFGSLATLVGNPQNMLVGSFSHLSYARFSAVMTPVAIAGLAVASVLLPALCRGMLGSDTAVVTPAPVTLDRPLLRKSLWVSALLLVALLAGVSPALAALTAAALLLITRRVDPDQVFARVDWSLLLMFAGLFVVIAGLERAGWPARALATMGPRLEHSLGGFVGATVILSNLVSNVPAVLLLKTWTGSFQPAERAWLLLAMASTLAGNLTLVGSVANLIVVESARGRATVGFWSYLRVGLPLTIVTLGIGVAWVIAVAR
ncbi:MAG TPA: anion transporter [Dongiaceae bacterium]|nr:anion transporter [Dongiaceae bacterium]